jgi:PAS domain S-box-containing protein
MKYVLRLLAIIIAVFFAGFFIEDSIERLPASTIPLEVPSEILYEILPILMSFSIFTMTWFAYSKSRDNQCLFMGMIFLVIGLIDLCHTISYPYMPNFITPNSLQKSAVLHSEARLISSVLFVVGAYVKKDSLPELINKPVLFFFAIVLFLVSLVPALFYLNRLPSLYSDGGRSTALIIRQFITTMFLLYASYLFARRYQRTGERYLIYLVYGFIILIISDLVYFNYGMPGHLLKLTAFFFLYLALYRSSVELPYEKLEAAEENLLHTAEEKYRNLFDNANDAIITTDINGRITSWNKSAERIFGWAEQEAVGKDLFSLICSERVAATSKEQIVSSALARKIVSGIERACLRKDRTKIYVSLTASAIQDINQSIIGISAIIRDITERKLAEEALRRAYGELESRVQERTAELAETNQALQTEIKERRRIEEQLRRSIRQLNAILTNIPDIAWLKDKESRFIAVSKPFADTAGMRPADLIGKTDFDIWPKELAERYRADDREVMATGRRKQVIEPLVDKEGKKTWIETIKTPIHDDRGNIIGTTGIARDVTERKRLEEEREKWTAELARSNAELEQFAYIASHDIQEPLRMVSGFTQLLARRYKDRLDKDADEFIAYIMDGTTRMQRMIEDLLAYSRVGTRGKPFEPTDLEDILNQAVTNLKVAIEENRAQITHDPMPTVMADSTQIAQLFQNLIANSIKFRKKEEPPRIHISAQRKEEDWFFSVEDNGIGISPEFMGHLFQIFQREHAANKYPGTGIGLAICKRIVERHGGRIWAESLHGRGSVFYFTIPARKENR